MIDLNHGQLGYFIKVNGVYTYYSQSKKFLNEVEILFHIFQTIGIGHFCDLNQDVRSHNYTEGAAVAIEMSEYERGRDACPMHFDDGSNPWKETENAIIIFDFGLKGSSTSSRWFN